MQIRRINIEARKTSKETYLKQVTAHYRQKYILFLTMGKKIMDKITSLDFRESNFRYSAFVKDVNIQMDFLYFLAQLRKEVISRAEVITRRKKETVDKFLNYVCLKKGGQSLSDDVDKSNMYTTTSLPNQIIELTRERLEEGAPKQTSTSPLRIFGVEIGALRRKKGLSLEQLSEMSSIDTKTLLSIECGFLTLEQVVKNLPAIAEALEEDPQALMRFFFSLL
jgi:hypothetical protein